MKKVFMLVFFVFYSMNSYAVSFNCDKASNETEKLICTNKTLSNLDDYLAFHYSRLKEVLPRTEQDLLIEAQIKWLKTRNTACKSQRINQYCLSKAYRNRINSLIRSYDKRSWPDEDKINQICTELAALDSDGRADYGSGKSIEDINNDGVAEVSHSCQGGTMNTPCINYTDTKGKPVYIKTINFEWKDYWTFGLHTFEMDGTVYRFHSRDDYFKKPSYLSLISPGNNEHVLCEFENREIVNLRPNPELKGAETICKEIENEKSPNVTIVEFSDEPIFSDSDVEDRGRPATSNMGQGFLDYNNDGEDDYLIHLDYASGAGRGCDFNYFDVLSKDKTSFEKSEQGNLLLQMQKIHLKYRNPTDCSVSWGGHRMNIFMTYNGKNYYALKVKHNPGVYLIENDKIHKVCSIEKTIQSTVKSH